LKFNQSEERNPNSSLSQRHTMLVFLLDCLRFSKLLKFHQTEGRISSNLLKRKQSSRKTSIVCHWLNWPWIFTPCTKYLIFKKKI